MASCSPATPHSIPCSPKQHNLAMANDHAAGRGQPPTQDSAGRSGSSRAGATVRASIQANVAALHANRESVAECNKTERFGCRVCRVMLGGADVGLAQIWAGLACYFRRYAKELPPDRRQQHADAEAQAHAQAERRGLWARAGGTVGLAGTKVVPFACWLGGGVKKFQALPCRTVLDPLFSQSPAKRP